MLLAVYGSGTSGNMPRPPAAAEKQYLVISRRNVLREIRARRDRQTAPRSADPDTRVPPEFRAAWRPSGHTVRAKRRLHRALRGFGLKHHCQTAARHHLLQASPEYAACHDFLHSSHKPILINTPATRNAKTDMTEDRRSNSPSAVAITTAPVTTAYRVGRYRTKG